MYLLDTHILLWYLHDDDRLSDKTKTIISDNDISISIASLWEIAIKKGLGKLKIYETVSDLEKVCNEQDIEIIPIKTKYLEVIQTLPYIHNDPFDRLIIATASTDGMTLITDDKKIKNYSISQISQNIDLLTATHKGGGIIMQ